MKKEFKVRTDIINFVPDNGVMAELGVMQGEFTETYIQEAVKRNIQVYLVDIWDNENNAKVYSKWDKNIFNKWYNTVVKKFSKYPNVTIVKSTTTEFLNSIPDKSLDLVYIDADHTFDGVYKDISDSIPKIKNNGYISGHDFDPVGPEHFKYNDYEFGITKAVNMFWNEKDILLTGDTEKYYKSWCCKVNKLKK